jgi:glycosyltransferase involved in cell wall biosynthesis
MSGPRAWARLVRAGIELTGSGLRSIVHAITGPFAAHDSEWRLRVAVVAAQIIKGDGTSNAVRDTIRAVSTVADWEVTVFAHRSQFRKIRIHRVPDSKALARHPRFARADIIIYHFGFRDPMFEIIPIGNGHARQIVFFHNITPAEFLPDWLKPDIARSFQQLRHLAKADRLWAFTSTNAKVLTEAGMDRDRIEIVAPVVEWPPPGLLAAKSALPVRLLFVGRMIQSKGVLDLLSAVELLRSRSTAAFRLSLVGATVDRDYRAAVRDRVAVLGPGVELLGRIESGALEHCYRSAHILVIPSYHEGFCRPVAEGLRAGCIPVGYASHHLPVVAKGLGRLVAPGDVSALADALQAMIESIAPALATPGAAILPLDRGPTSVRLFDKLANTHLRNFSFDRLTRRVVGGIRELTDLAQPNAIVR